MGHTIRMNRFFSILYNFLTYITAYGEIDFMNSTGVVGYIALLMICGSILGGDGQVNF